MTIAMPSLRRVRAATRALTIGIAGSLIATLTRESLMRRSENG